MKYLWIILVVFLSGCSAPSGKAVVETPEVKVTVTQPANAKTPATIDVEDSGEIHISTGMAHNTIESVNYRKLLQLPIFGGIGIIAFGIFAGLVLKQPGWMFTLLTIGGGMIAGTFLLAKYSLWLMIGSVILVAYFVVTKKKIRPAD